MTSQTSRPLGSKPTAATTAQPRVLIVDDDSAVRLVLRRWFARRGWHTEEAPNGSKAQAFLTAGSASFDMVLCDVRMPEVSGPEFYSWLSIAMPNAISRLVFTTGDASEDSVAAFLRSSRCTVLEKPFDLDALWSIAERLRREQVAA